MKPYHKIKEFIDQLNLIVDQNQRTNCPACGGVNTFIIHKYIDGTVYFCHRGSCQVSGKVDGVITKRDIEEYMKLSKINHEQMSQKFTLPEYIRTTTNLTEEANKIRFEYLDRYPWLKKKDLLWDVKDDRLVFPIFDEKGDIVEAIGRSLGWRTKPKWKVYGNGEVPYITKADNHGTIIIVEDAVSAERIADAGVNSCALLGTYMRDSYIKYLKLFYNAIIMLDSDVPKESAKVKTALSQYMLCEVNLLTDVDIKDMSEEQFNEFVLEKKN